MPVCTIKYLSDFDLTDMAAMTHSTAAKAWIDLFSSLREVCRGYSRPRLTPYMHLLPYHIFLFVQQHGCLKKYTGQGVEKLR